VNWYHGRKGRTPITFRGGGERGKEGANSSYFWRFREREGYLVPNEMSPKKRGES